MWQLGDWSLWIDEAHSWRDATMPLDAKMGWFLRSDRAFYPLTFLLLRNLLDLQVIGSDEWSLRLPFAAIGIVTVPLLAWCGRSLVGAGPAAIASLLLAVNPWHIYWSQNARGYVIAAFATVLAANRAHAWLVTDRPIDMIAAAAAIGLGALGHPTTALLALGFATCLWARRALFQPGRRRSLAS